ncbi:MAG: hypothetical protein ACI8P2_004321, partial [Candidatus Latescibacterota bacterium]
FLAGYLLIISPKPRVEQFRSFSPLTRCGA